MNRFRLTWLGSIALLCSPIAAWSQEPGSRVRITELEATGSARHTGTVVSAGADAVVLRLDRGGKTVAFPLASLSRFEVSRGRKGHTRAGAWLGFLAGAGVGALVGSANCGSACSGSDNLGGLNALIWAGIGGGIGMAVGAVAGGSLKTDRWESVPPGRWHISAWPAGHGRFGLALSLRF